MASLAVVRCADAMGLSGRSSMDLEWASRPTCIHSCGYSYADAKATLAGRDRLRLYTGLAGGLVIVRAQKKRRKRPDPSAVPDKIGREVAKETFKLVSSWIHVAGRHELLRRLVSSAKQVAENQWGNPIQWDNATARRALLAHHNTLLTKALAAILGRMGYSPFDRFPQVYPLVNEFAAILEADPLQWWQVPGCHGVFDFDCEVWAEEKDGASLWNDKPADSDFYMEGLWVAAMVVLELVGPVTSGMTNMRPLVLVPDGCAYDFRRVCSDSGIGQLFDVQEYVDLREPLQAIPGVHSVILVV
eukprot:1141490-Amphidinium_carterae.1